MSRYTTVFFIWVVVLLHFNGLDDRETKRQISADEKRISALEAIVHDVYTNEILLEKQQTDAFRLIGYMESKQEDNLTMFAVLRSNQDQLAEFTLQTVFAPRRLQRDEAAAAMAKASAPKAGKKGASVSVEGTNRP